MPNTANLSVRIDPELKAQAESLFSDLMKRIVILLFGCFICLMAFSGCDNNSKQVPDSVLQQFVFASDVYKSYKEYDSNCRFSWTAKHQTDKSAHTDLVEITINTEGTYMTRKESCSVLYQYDRTSDLWTVIKDGQDWDSEFRFSKALEGEWPITQTNNSGETECIGTLYIDKVDEDEIQLRCEISAYETKAWFPDTLIQKAFDAKTTTTVPNNDECARLVFSIPLPENFRSYSQGHGYSNDITIRLYVSYEEGVYDISGFIDEDQILYEG